MIVDRLSNWQLYRGLPPRFVRAFDFLRDQDVQQLALGRHDLEGDRLFALVQEYSTRPVGECRWEAHQRYCDLQFLVRGVERIGVENIEFLQVQEPYDAAKDVAFFLGEGGTITLRGGSFAIFAPQDVHRPCQMAGSQAEPVRKIVFKIEV